MKEYDERDVTLRSMGFPSYQDYLNSRLWKRIRLRTLKRDKSKCRVCKEPATGVHHKSYSKSVLLGQDITKLVSLCSTCHDLAEFNRFGIKTNLRQANQMLERLAALPKDKPRHRHDYRENRRRKHKPNKRQPDMDKCRMCERPCPTGTMYCHSCKSQLP